MNEIRNPAETPGEALSNILIANKVFVKNRGAEIGVRCGETSEALLKGTPNLNLYLVDPFAEYLDFEWLWSAEEQAKTEKIAHERLIPYGERAIWCKATSLQAAGNIEDESLDFVFIDGDHRTKWALMDMAIWYTKVRPGGLLTGHDYCAAAGVKASIHAVAHVYGKKITHIAAPDIWIMKI